MSWNSEDKTGSFSQILRISKFEQPMIGNIIGKSRLCMMTEPYHSSGKLKFIVKEQVEVNCFFSTSFFGFQESAHLERFIYCNMCPAVCRIVRRSIAGFRLQYEKRNCRYDCRVHNFRDSAVFRWPVSSTASCVLETGFYHNCDI